MYIMAMDMTIIIMMTMMMMTVIIIVQIDRIVPTDDRAFVQTGRVDQAFNL